MIPYKHEPFTDFTKEENKAAYLEGLKTVETYLGKEYPIIVGGERIFTDDKTRSYNPSNIEETVGLVSKASKEHAEKAMEAAKEAFKTWRETDPSVRADVLLEQLRLQDVVNMNSLHYFLKKVVNLGKKPMLIQLKQSILWNTMLVKC